MLKRISLALLLMLLVLPAVQAQEPPTLVELDNLRDELPEQDPDSTVIRADKIAISPDGMTIAKAGVDGICLYSVGSGEVQCSGYPPHYPANVNSLAWSSDSTTLVFTEPIMRAFADSDIWVINFGAETYGDLTDDGLRGDFFNEPAYQLDMLPLWNPVSGDLYFIRYERIEGADADTTAVYRIPAGSDAPELVYYLSSDILVLDINRPMVFSADGTRLAFAVTPPDFQENPEAGIWILDITSGITEQVATAADLRIGLPTWATLDMQPDALYWAGDNLVVWAFNYDFFDPITHHAIYVDLASGEVTPLADYSDVPDADALVARNTSGEIPSIRIPRSGAVVGDSFVYLGYFQESTDFASIRAIALPPDGSPSVELGQITDFEPRFGTHVASVSGNTVYMRGYRLVFE